MTAPSYIFLSFVVLVIAGLIMAGGAGSLYVAQSAYWTLSANFGGKSAGAVSGFMNIFAIRHATRLTTRAGPSVVRGARRCRRKGAPNTPPNPFRTAQQNQQNQQGQQGHAHTPTTLARSGGKCDVECIRRNDRRLATWLTSGPSAFLATTLDF